MASKTVKQESFVVLTACERNAVVDGDDLDLTCLENSEQYFFDSYLAEDAAEDLAKCNAEDFSSDEIQDGDADLFIAKVTISTFKRIKVTGGVTIKVVADTGCDY